MWIVRCRSEHVGINAKHPIVRRVVGSCIVPRVIKTYPIVVQLIVGEGRHTIYVDDVVCLHTQIIVIVRIYSKYTMLHKEDRHVLDFKDICVTSVTLWREYMKNHKYIMVLLFPVCFPICLPIVFPIVFPILFPILLVPLLPVLFVLFCSCIIPAILLVPVLCCVLVPVGIVTLLILL